MEDFFTSSNSLVWFFVGIAFIVLEVTLIPGVGMLFAGLAAITLGAAIAFEVLHIDGFFEAIAYFFIFTTFWAVLLWKPLKNAMKKGADDSYNNMVGTTGTVIEEGGLQAGKQGSVKWSGTIMRARLIEESDRIAINEGEEVWVHEVKDGVLMVDVEKPIENDNSDD